jgi:hypothetical protein
MTISRFLSSLLLISVFGAQSAIAQQLQTLPSVEPSNPQVAMIMLRVEHNKGQDFIITPKGFKAQIPGKGIASSAKAVAVYQDQQKNYWYIDKHGEPTPVRPEVVQSVMAQFGAEVQQTQAVAPLASGVAGTAGGAPVQQTTIVQQPAASGGSSGMGSTMGVASMAMSGAALGMSIGALSNSSHGGYYGMPYGKPMYQENHHYYYNNNSKKVYVSPNNHTKQTFDQWNKQGAWNDRHDRRGRFRR